MKFAIRDDDVSYFTNKNEIIEAYDFYFNNNIPITLSVIPVAINHHGDNYPYGRGPFDCEYGKVGENLELCHYIRNMIGEKKVEVIMHGIHHKYYLKNDEWIPEMCILKKTQIYESLTMQLDYMKEVFSCPIDVFAAPSNSMNKDTFWCLEKKGLNTMCIISKKFDHPLSFKFLYYYCIRNIKKMLGANYSMGLMKYNNHQELPIYGLNDFEIMKKQYLQCKKKDVPFIIYTHYWELNNDMELALKLKNIVDFMIKDSAIPTMVSKCFDM